MGRLPLDERGAQPEGIQGRGLGFRGEAPHEPPTRLGQQFNYIIDPDDFRCAALFADFPTLLYSVKDLHNCTELSCMLHGASLAFILRAQRLTPTITWISLPFGVSWRVGAC